MTAHDLIVEIFSRVQRGPSNVRCITRPQMDLLRRLIAEDREAGAMRSDGPGVFVWRPSGRNRYVITEDLSGRRHTLTRESNAVTSGAGMLFQV